MFPECIRNPVMRPKGGWRSPSETSRWPQPSTSTGSTTDEVRDTLTQAGGLVLMLARSDRAERAALYRALGLILRYEKKAPTGQERVHARLELCRGGGGI